MYSTSSCVIAGIVMQLSARDEAAKFSTQIYLTNVSIRLVEKHQIF